MQVWKIDTANFYVGESYFVEEPSTNEITTPITIGYVKPRWNGVDWFEGANVNEIQAWKDSELVVTEPTELELLQEQIETSNQAITELSMIIGGMF